MLLPQPVRTNLKPVPRKLRIVVLAGLLACPGWSQPAALDSDAQPNALSAELDRLEATGLAPDANLDELQNAVTAVVALNQTLGTRLEAVTSELQQVKDSLALLGDPVPAEDPVSLAQRQALTDRQDELQDRLDGLAAVSEQTASQVAELARAKAELEQVSQSLVDLGPPPSAEPPEVTQERLSQQARQKALEIELRRLTLRKARADKIEPGLQARVQALVAEQMLHREPGVVAIALRSATQPADWLKLGALLTNESSLLRLESPALLVLWVLLLTGAALFGLRVRRELLAKAEGITVNEFGDKLLQTVLVVFGRHAPGLFPVGLVAAALSLRNSTTPGQPLLTNLSYGVLLFLSLRVGVRIGLAPSPPAQPLVPFEPELSRAIARRVGIVMLISVFGFLLLGTLHQADLPEDPYLLLRALFVVLLTLNAAWLFWLVDRLPLQVLRGNRTVRGLLIVLLGLAAFAELLGYRHLSAYLLRSLFGTVLASPAIWIVMQLYHELFDGLRVGRRQWQRQLREKFGVASGQAFPGLFWLRFVAGLLLWTGTGLLLARLWLSQAGFQSTLASVNKGFQLGQMTVVPSRVFLGLLVFGLLLSLRNLFRGLLSRGLVEDTALDAGARQATITILSYLGFAAAALLALHIMGINLKSLAVVAGALSVGIGFGLQNIVSNFVSGLILLFERPIKVGDWIVVGETEGYVRKFTVRSTEIQTFDRAEVIVPNADLITQAVINKTRYNPVARIDVPVGVAYGSDVELVRELLLEVGNNHDAVLKDASFPQVLFRGFGDSSLDFELRCLIRDVDQKLIVTSDLNFAIDRVFREHAIEIPFPQRDLWVRGLPQEAAEGLGSPSGDPTDLESADGDREVPGQST